MKFLPLTGMIEIHSENTKTCVEQVEGGVIITIETGFERNSSPRRFVKERDFSPQLKKLLGENSDGAIITVENKEKESEESIYE